MSTAGTYWAQLGLLDGVPAEGRAARRRLLERLQDDGYRTDELQAAAADGTLTALPTLLLLGGPRASAPVRAPRPRGSTSGSCSTHGAPTASR